MRQIMHAPPPSLDAVEAATRLNRRMVQTKYAKRGECAICIQEMQGQPVTVTPCGHVFHLSCEQRLLRSSCPSRRMCPICRRRLHRGVDTIDEWEALEEWLRDFGSRDTASFIASILRV